MAPPPRFLLPLLILLLVGRPAPAAAQAPVDSVRHLQLDEAVQMALRQSPVLDQAAADLRVSQVGRTSALGSFLPDISVGYGYSNSSTGRLDPTGQAITRSSYSTNISGSLQLFDGLRRFHDLEGANRSLSAREALYEQRRYEAILDVKTAFYDAVAARERIRVERARVERQEEQLDFVRQQIALGRVTRSDSLRSRVDLNDARVALLNARNDARGAEMRLAQVIGTDSRVAPAEEAALSADTLRWSREELVRLARERSPRVRNARLSAEATDADVSSARSAYLPSLSLQGGYDWQSEVFPPENRSWSLRLTGSIPIFNGLQRETSVARAEAQSSAARAAVRSEELAIRSDVDDAYSQLETALAGLRLAEESVELTREDLRVSEQRYRLGAATILDLQAAQIALQEAQVDVIRRQFDYRVGLARLESLLGTTLDELQRIRENQGGDAGETEAP